jgi:hypothetical protein
MHLSQAIQLPMLRSLESKTDGDNERLTTSNDIRVKDRWGQSCKKNYLTCLEASMQEYNMTYTVIRREIKLERIGSDIGTNVGAYKRIST